MLTPAKYLKGGGGALKAGGWGGGLDGTPPRVSNSKRKKNTFYKAHQHTSGWTLSMQYNARDNTLIEERKSSTCSRICWGEDMQFCEGQGCLSSELSSEDVSQCSSEELEYPVPLVLGGGGGG